MTTSNRPQPSVLAYLVTMTIIALGTPHLPEACRYVAELLAVALASWDFNRR
jgi:hypothetical protein